MKLVLDKNSEAKALEIFQAIASTNRDKSWEAQEALAALVGPIVDQVLDQTPTHKLIYETVKYKMDDGPPEIPIDAYYGNTEGALQVWSQSMPGSLSSNLVHGGDQYRFTTHTVNSAVSFLKKYAEKGRLDVLAKGIKRLAEEVLVVQEYQAWFVLLAGLANATTDGATHLISATTAGTFQLDDLNRLFTKAKRIRKSWVGGTPLSRPGKGVTDLVVSPEVIEDIRAMAYQPMNTRAGSITTSGATAVALPDNLRLEAWNAAGAASFFGVRIHELLEFGVAQPYGHLFDQVYSGSPSFAQNTQELVLGVDLSVDGTAIMVEATDRSDGVFRVQADDQWTSRSGKIGWYGQMEAGYMVADNKALVGLIV